MSDIPDAVAEQYREGRLPLHECERLISGILDQSRFVYLVIDALDECDAARFRRSLLQSLSRLSQSKSLRLLMFGRPHIEDLDAMFGPHLRIKIEAQIDDLAAYISQELASAGVYDMAGPSFAARVVERITTEADGM